MDPESVAFWGIQIKPDDPLNLDLQGGETLHVSMASFCENMKDKTGRSVVYVSTGDMENKFAVCVLNGGKTESATLDIQFEGEEKVIFSVTGKNEVHLTGNFTFDEEADDEDDDEGEDLMETIAADMNGLDDDEDDSESDEGMKDDVMNEPPKITELGKDEESEDEPVVKPSKKNKKKDSNGTSAKKDKKSEKKPEDKKTPGKKDKTPKKDSEIPKKEKVAKKEAETPKKEKTPAKRKSVEPEMTTPAKKIKQLNGSPEMSTPDSDKSARKRHRKRRSSKAGNTPHAKHSE